MSETVNVVPVSDTPPVIPPVPPPAPAPRFPWLSKLLPIVLMVLGLFVGVPAGAVMFGAGLPGCSAPAPTPPDPAPSKYPTVTLPAKISVPRTDHIFYVRLTTDAVNVVWQIPDGLAEQSDVVTKAGVKALAASAEGTYCIRVWGAKGDYPSNLAVSEVTVGSVPPGPVPPPVPPTPPPTPPTPPVPPTPPSPIPTDGFRVMVVHDKSKQTVPQSLVINSKQVRDYLDTKCPKGPDGKTPEYRFYDKGEDVGNEAQVWQDAMKLPRPSLPWVLIGTGTTGYSGPLPATVDEFLKLLKVYGG